MAASDPPKLNQEEKWFALGSSLILSFTMSRTPQVCQWSFAAYTLNVGDREVEMSLVQVVDAKVLIEVEHWNKGWV